MYIRKKAKKPSKLKIYSIIIPKFLNIDDAIKNVMDVLPEKIEIKKEDCIRQETVGHIIEYIFNDKKIFNNIEIKIYNNIVIKYGC